MACPQRFLKVGRRGGAGQVEALSHLVAEGTEQIELFEGFDAFGDHGEVESVCQSEDAFEHGKGRCVGGGAGDERAVDLDDVDGQTGQGAQGGVAGSEVVDRDAGPEALQRVECGDSAVDFGGQCGLCDFQDDLVGVGCGVGEDVVDGGQVAGVG